MNTSANPTISASAIALGGEDRSVTLRSGAQETVKVRLLRIAEFPAYFACLSLGEEAIAEMLCGKPPGWAADVVPESLMDLVRAGHDLNFSAVLKWAQFRAEVECAARPVLEKAGVVPTPSATLSPNSPPAPAAR